jgi:hypothetical protein
MPVEQGASKGNALSRPGEDSRSLDRVLSTGSPVTVRPTAWAADRLMEI